MSKDLVVLTWNTDTVIWAILEYHRLLHRLQRERERERERNLWILYCFFLFFHYIWPIHLKQSFFYNFNQIIIGYAIVNISLRVKLKQDGGETTLIDLTWADTVTVSNREYSDVKGLTRAAAVWTGNQLLSLACLPVRAWVSQTEVTVVIRDDRAIRPFLRYRNRTN